MAAPTPTRAHKADWEALARLDPYYAILGDPAKRFGAWDEGEFFASGAYEVGLLMEAVARHGRPVLREHALEVGCGAGRVTRHLAEHFAHCHGLDIAPGMIDLARTANRDLPGCTWRVGNGSDLADLADQSYDLVFSHLVLQHCPSRGVIAGLISEMARVLRPGGLLVFQLPVSMPLRRRLQPRRRAYRLLRGLRVPESVLYERLRLHPIRMNWLPDAQVRRAIAQGGGFVLEVRDGWLGDRRTSGGEKNRTYVVSR